MKNEPAFPTTEEHGLNSGMPGMTLRDYFAAHAPEQETDFSWSDIKKLLKLPNNAPIEGWTPEMSRLCAAKKRYEYADAMLRAREVQP